MPSSSSRKQAAALRTRRKAALEDAPDGVGDPFHNGQTPACQGLARVVLDVFPELRERDVKNERNEAPSELGKLLRRNFLRKRRLRKRASMLPPPPLGADDDDPATPVDATNPPQDDNAKSSTRKKRKKKKKKKSTDASTTNQTEPKSADDVQQSQPPTTDQTIVDQLPGRELDSSYDAKGSDLGDSIHSVHGDIESCPLKDGPTRGDMSRRPRRRNGGSNGDARSVTSIESVDQLDQSVHDLLEDIQASTNEPGLASLPSDDRLNESGKVKLGNSLTFFEQIKPQESPSVPKPLKALSTSSDPPETPKSSPVVNDKTPPSAPKPVLTPTRQVSNSSSEPISITSPTHDWVPEEAAQFEEEIPPGDVIQNPLELPFLLTLKESTALTTAFDGTPVGTESPTPPTNSRLETTKLLLDEWLDPLLKDDALEQDNNSQDVDWDTFLSYVCSSQKGIPLEEWRNCCKAIRCILCQREATDTVDKILEKTKVYLNPSILREMDEHDDTIAAAVSQAFDYDAFEEGQYVPPTGKEEEADEMVDSASCIQFRVVESKQKKNTSKQLLLDDGLAEKLDLIAEEWLPCGIEEDILVRTTLQKEELGSSIEKGRTSNVLTDKEMYSFTRGVLEQVGNIHESLKDIRSNGDDLITQTNEARSVLVESVNLEFKAYPAIKNCDKSWSSYVALVLDNLESISTHQSVLAELQLYLWTIFLTGLNKTLKSCDRYYNHVADVLTDQQGVVPKLFVSAPMKEQLLQLVEEKVRVWTEIGDSFIKKLDNRTLREGRTHAAWEADNSPPGFQNNRANPLDATCHQLVSAMVDWTETIVGSRISEIMRDRMQRTERLLATMLSVVKPLSEEYETVEKFFSTERNHYFASLRNSIVVASGVKKRMRLIDDMEVQCMATGLILMWRHVRIVQDRMLRETPVLPLQLKRWTLLDDHSMVEGSFNGNFSTCNALCHPGKGGKRRAMCVLAGLFYGWLLDRFKEWKAEMAQKELMNDFALENTQPTKVLDNASLSNGKTTKSKKTKKKKKQSSATATEEVAVNPTEKTAKDKITPTSNGSGDAQSSTVISNIQSSSSNVEQVDHISVESLEDNIDSPPPEEGFPSLVFVESKILRLSAREFLEDRLAHALVASDTIILSS